MNYFGLDDFLLNALREDIGTGDITTNSCVPEMGISHGQLIAKEDGIVCGIDVLTRVFQLVDPHTKVLTTHRDGDKVSKGDIIAKVEGRSRSVLSGERVALNLIQHMSGIATQTNEAVVRIAGTNAKIVDTRKTLPGMRNLEKYAVKVGGGFNHRFSLADGVLIKDNHIVAAGGITKTIELVRQNVPHTLKIEIETETLEQVQEAVNAGADIIMLDNMTTEQMTEAVKLIDGRALTEASGNMDRRDLAEVAATGVDFISIGALTHTAKALDISLKF